MKNRLPWKLEVKAGVEQRRLASEEKRFWYGLAKKEFEKASSASKRARNEVRKYMRSDVLASLKETASLGQVKEQK